ncbi:MAG: UDP-N-acetylmuramoyl-tripeptide--D-alanyl-D-alanine ligase [Gemmatimonadales bacterium]
MTAPWSESFVCAALGTGPPTAEASPFSEISTDTRALGPDALFVALTGERFDGHEFLATARDGGASGAVVRHGTPSVEGLRLYPVDDTLVALGRLARHRRDIIDGPVVAITGSNGKTSTKEMIAAVLGTRFRTHATHANLNNLIGIPLTILQTPADAQALVLEAGASVPGEIDRSREIIDPTAAVITNVGASHLEGFGSEEGVLREKLELVRQVPLAVVGPEPTGLATGATALAERVVTAGLRDSDVVPESIEFGADGHAVVRIDGLSFRIPGPGKHLAANAMLAWAVVRELGLEPLAAAAALEGARFPGGRGDIRCQAGLTILDDSYNANPESFRAAIATAERLRPGHRLVWVVGTMRELGGSAAEYHEAIAGELVSSKPDLLAALGAFVPALEAHREQLGDSLISAADVAGLGAALAPRLEAGDLVVLKASRGVALEGILPYLLDHVRSPDG